MFNTSSVTTSEYELETSVNIESSTTRFMKFFLVRQRSPNLFEHDQFWTIEVLDYTSILTPLLAYAEVCSQTRTLRQGLSDEESYHSLRYV